MVTPSLFLTAALVFFSTRSFLLPLTNITVPKHIVYFCLPFTSAHSLQIWTKLVKLVSSCFPQIDLYVIKIW